MHVLAVANMPGKLLEVDLFDAKEHRLPMGPNRDQQWSRGLCHCRLSTCICVSCCSCIPIGQLYEKMITGNGTEDGQCLRVCLCVLCSHYCCHAHVTAHFLALLRFQIRSKYAIPEEHCFGLEDVCCAYFCAPCVLSQMMEHVHAYALTGGSAFNISATGDPVGLDLDLAHMPAMPQISETNLKEIDTNVEQV